MLISTTFFELMNFIESSLPVLVQTTPQSYHHQLRLSVKPCDNASLKGTLTIFTYRRRGAYSRRLVMRYIYVKSATVVSCLSLLITQSLGPLDVSKATRRA